MGKAVDSAWRLAITRNLLTFRSPVFNLFPVIYAIGQGNPTALRSPEELAKLMNVQKQSARTFRNAHLLLRIAFHQEPLAVGADKVGNSLIWEAEHTQIRGGPFSKSRSLFLLSIRFAMDH